MFAKQLRCLSNKATGFLVASRSIQLKANIAVAASKQFTPVSIDVPWGKVEGKLWGSADKQPILAVHGFMDNAGTFDDIAPYLLKNSSILAIDLPGHGLSSWLPRGIPYTEDLHTMAMRMVVKNFGWNKVKLLGHSLGAIMCYNYARLFPRETQFVVSLDALAFAPYVVARHSKSRAKGIDRYIEYDKKLKDTPPSYPEEVAIQKWIDGTVFLSLDVPTTKTLMIRGAKRNEDGTYSYTRDAHLRMTGFQGCYTLDDIQEMTKLITSPYLVIKATDTPYHDEFLYWDNVIEILKKTSSDCRVFSVDGNHHVHMMKPELVASHIIPFLEKHDI